MVDFKSKLKNKIITNPADFENIREDMKIKEKVLKESKNNGSHFPNVVLTQEDLENVKKQIKEHQELKDGVSFLRDVIISHEPTFFDALKDPECFKTGWDLILSAVIDGIEHRKHKYCNEKTE
jgi:hypothetical protein